jgi:hypothetical protein
MAQHQHIHEGTARDLAPFMAQHPNQRFRLIELSEDEEPTPEVDSKVSEAAPLADPKAAASIALLRQWIAEAPTDPEGIREAEEDLREFKKNMNKPRKEAGARLLFPEVE